MKQKELKEMLENEAPLLNAEKDNVDRQELNAENLKAVHTWRF